MAQASDHGRLLFLEADAIFGLDDSNPSHTVVSDKSLHAVLNWSTHATVTATSRDLATKRASDAHDMITQAIDSFMQLQQHNPQPYSSGIVPAALVHLKNTLDIPSAITGGPTYIIPRQVSTDYAGSAPPTIRFLQSSSPSDRTRAASCTRPSVWEYDEWNSLINCHANHPWAMAITDSGEPVCICHTSARNSQVVEAGIWTREDFRGQGLAPMTVASWSGLHKDGITVFYSTSIENDGSKSVARKLGLVEFGYIWKLLVDSSREA